MSQQPNQQPGFSLFRFSEFELLFVEMAAAIILTTLTFMALGSLAMNLVPASSSARSAIITDAARKMALEAHLPQ